MCVYSAQSLHRCVCSCPRHGSRGGDSSLVEVRHLHRHRSVRLKLRFLEGAAVSLSWRAAGRRLRSRALKRSLSFQNENCVPPSVGQCFCKAQLYHDVLQKDAKKRDREREASDK